MIQLNLLPDVKLQYIKARATKRLVMVIALLATAVSITLLIVMFSLTAFQKRHISQLDKDIKKYQQELQDTPDLAKILTIQNQLKSLPGLYAKRPVTSRLFPYLEQTTPAQVGISKLDLNFTDTTLKIEGTTDTLESVNKFVDTLKFTSYTAVGSEEVLRPFSDVVMAKFSRDAKEAKYTVEMKFDTAIFDGAKEVSLAVPQTITTRSETELPTGVFDTKTPQ